MVLVVIGLYEGWVKTNVPRFIGFCTVAQGLLMETLYGFTSVLRCVVFSGFRVEDLEDQSLGLGKKGLGMSNS